MTKPLETDVEKRLNEMMSRYPNVNHSLRLQEILQRAVLEMHAAGYPDELIGFSVAQQACACVATLKMTQRIDPHLADALAEDFFETIHRAFPGDLQLRSKQ